MFSTTLFKSNLITKKLGHDIHYLIKTDSTNDEIWDMFCKYQINEGGALISEYQNKGRGRQGNTWYSSESKNLTFSFLIHNETLCSDLISLSCSIGIVNGIKEFTGLNCNLKWPNDIMFENYKIGGILIEKKNDFFIIGIGLNVNESQFHISLKDRATSLKNILNHKIDRSTLLAYIFNNLENCLNLKNDVIIKTWLSLCNHINKNINFYDSNKKKIQAKFTTINNNGEAVLNINGKQKIIQSGFIEQ